MAVMHIMSAGTFAPSRGDEVTFSAEDLARIATAYSVKRRQAPLTIGHPRDDRPVVGIVDRLIHHRTDLVAVVRNVSPQTADLIKCGRFPRVSPALLRPSDPRNPSPGTWYLKHVGLLGAAAPLGSSTRSRIFNANELTNEPCAPSRDLAPANSNIVAFAAPAGYAVDQSRLLLHQTIREVMAATPGMTYEEALAALLAR